MKLQPNAKKMTRLITVGCCICSVLMIGVFGLLHLLNIYGFTYTILTGAVAGTFIAVLNFVLMCLTIQAAANTADEKSRKSKLQLSYNGRMVLQAGWVVAAFLLPWFQAVAAALPLLFPTIVIIALRRSGKLNEPSQRKYEEPQEEEETV